MDANKNNQGGPSAIPQCAIVPLPGIGERRKYRCVTQPFAAHVHDHYVIGLVEGGRRTMRCNEEVHELVPGDLVVLNPGDVHACEQGDEALFAYDSIAVDASVLEGAPLSGPVIRSREAQELFNAVRAASEEGGGDALAEGVFRLCKALLEEGDANERDAHLNDDAARRVVAHFCDHLSDPESLDELAAREGMSTYSLIRAYRNLFSITPMKHLTSLRVECACRLLAEGVEPATVAIELGFSDQPHLTRAFKQRVGVTPAAYGKMASRKGEHE